jgi:TldD protein
LQSGSAALLAAGLGFPRTVLALPSSTPVDVLPRAGDPHLRDLALRALDAARSVGALYADVRFTATRSQQFAYGSAPIEREDGAVGIRVYVDGAWGFAGSPLWSADEMVRLAREAALQARANRWPDASAAKLGDPPPAITGEWRMSVKRDPFDVSINEKLDYIHSIEDYVRQHRYVSPSSVIAFERQERTFASTDGSLFSQTVFTSLGDSSFFVVGYRDPNHGLFAGRYAPMITPSGAGYEALTESGLVEGIPQLVEDAKAIAIAQPLNPGRFDIVFDGAAFGQIVSASLGAALELDRALGLEANAGGTSYLDPDDVLGKRLGPTWLTVHGERSSVGGAASVALDDDGVAPDDFALVDAGTVVDYATNRTRAPALRDWYRGRGASGRSHGCAGSANAMDFPIIQRPNLRVTPASSSFDALVAQVDDGIAVKDGMCFVDQQQLNGQGIGGMAYRIRKGKLAEAMPFGTGYLFRGPELWKNLSALGGPDTVRRVGVTTKKGQPEQETVHTVSAPAALVKNMAVFDLISTMRARMQAGVRRLPTMSR